MPNFAPAISQRKTNRSDCRRVCPNYIMVYGCGRTGHLMRSLNLSFIFLFPYRNPSHTIPIHLFLDPVARQFRVEKGYSPTDTVAGVNTHAEDHMNRIEFDDDRARERMPRHENMTNRMPILIPARGCLGPSIILRVGSRPTRTSVISHLRPEAS
jgi:hypothetical protein